jgi:hypothetical protein
MPRRLGVLDNLKTILAIPADILTRNQENHNRITRRSSLGDDILIDAATDDAAEICAAEIPACRVCCPDLDR